MFKPIPVKPFVSFYSIRTAYGTSRIGNREVVGHGHCGGQNYKDDPHYPFPAVRFQENTGYIAALRQKEKGDWNRLTCEEKKTLYRASFCSTFAEFQAMTGTWKYVIGVGLFIIGWAFWLQLYYYYLIKDKPPESLLYENQKLQLRRMLEIRVNPIDGLASTWNYDEDNWNALAPGTMKREIIHMGIVDEPISLSLENLEKHRKEMLIDRERERVN